MKKLFIAFALTSTLFACKKETSTPDNKGNNTTDTTKTSDQTIGKLGSNITDVDGNSYKTVAIGTQTWMAENLKTSKYNDGSQIPNVTDYTTWSRLKTGAWAYYNNDSANYVKFGKLYNWYAVSYETNGNKNVCPIGWHVPTDTEWTVLVDYLGGFNVAGGKMKEVDSINWKNPNTDATNVSLFTGLPGGYRYSDGHFEFIGLYGNWWTSESKYPFTALSRILSYNNGSVSGSSDDNQKDGFSVRCLKD